MNNKFLLIIAVIVVLLGGFFLLSNKTKNNQITQNQTTQQTVKKSTPTVVQSTTVTVINSGFNPQVLTIKAGTRIIWINESGASVTVNSDVHPTNLLYPFLNLGEFNDGASVSIVVEKPGTYTYHNHLNPSQTGKIVAE